MDSCLGAPRSAWDGGARGSLRDAHTAHVGGHETREQRHQLLPALQALQSRVGWISEGGLNYVCTRLGVPPAEAYGVATFYALIATSPRPRRVLHVCDDIACRAKGARELCAALERDCGPPLSHAPHAGEVDLDAGRAQWMHSPCLGLCDRAPAALVTEAGDPPVERLVAEVTAERARALLAGAPIGADGSDNPPVPQREGHTTADTPALQLLGRIGATDPTRLDSYRAAGGYRALPRALELGAAGVIREVTEAKLLGRGGAAFPTGRKWESVRTQVATPHYLICNADESEPGTFKDRVLLTRGSVCDRRGHDHRGIRGRMRARISLCARGVSTGVRANARRDGGRTRRRAPRRQHPR